MKFIFEFKSSINRLFRIVYIAVNRIFKKIKIVIFLEPRCEVQVDLCLIVDSSQSITFYPSPYDNWKLQQEFLSLLVELFKIGPDDTRVGAVVFSEDVRLAFSLDQYTDLNSVQKAIFNITHLKQQTNTAEALRVTRESCFSAARGDRPGVQNLAVIITDGRPEPDSIRRIREAKIQAQALKEDRTRIISIGVTNEVEASFLRDISSSPQIQGENYFLAPRFDALGVIRRAVGEGTCEVASGNLYFRKIFIVFHFSGITFQISIRIGLVVVSSFCCLCLHAI